MATSIGEAMKDLPRSPAKVASARIRHYREGRGWSLRDFSRELDRRFDVKADAATLGRIETGERKITLDELSMLAVALGVPLGLMLWPVDENEPADIAPGVSLPPWDAFKWMVGNHGIVIEKEDQAAWRRARNPILWYSNIARRVSAALRLRAEDPEDDGISTDYLEQLRQLDDAVEQMKAGGYPIEGEGWALIPSDLMQDLKRFEGRLDEYRNRFQIWDEEEV